MEFIKQIERLQLLNKLVREQRTGSPEEFAVRIGVSRAKLYLIFEELRDQEICIRFNKKLNSFRYENCDGLQVGFSFKVLEAGEETSINAGNFFTFFPASIILDGTKLS